MKARSERSVALGDKKGSPKAERFVAFVSLLSILAAWLAGTARSKADIMPFLQELFPQARQVQALGDETFAVWEDDAGSELLGYVKSGVGLGYGGPMTVAVAVDTNGAVVGLAVVEHKDTQSYFERVMHSKLPRNLLGKTHAGKFVLGRDLDAVSGATRSATALVGAAQSAIRNISVKQLGVEVAAEVGRPIRFGIPEISLVILFVLSLISRRNDLKFTSLVRWVCLLTGLVVLGFTYNSPLTISMINQLLLGFWPDWHANLYAYLLIGGVLLLLVLKGKNPYCRRICPFGAAQECLGKLGKAKHRSSGRYRGLLKWMHRGLTLTAIIIALLFRDPGLTSYEIFGTLFRMIGTTSQFVLLALVLLTSLYVLRPWCNYICPIRTIEEYFQFMKRWSKQLWLRSGPRKIAKVH